MTTVGGWRRWAATTLEARGLEAGALVDALADAVVAVRGGWPAGAVRQPAADVAEPAPVEATPPADARRPRQPVVATGSIAELRHALRTRALSAEALLETTLARIEAANPRLNAFITVTAALARQQARTADEELARGVDRGPLHGLPVSLKDLIDVAGEPTTAASRVLADQRARRHAPVVDRLIEAGAVILGKTNLHEFAFGTTCEDSAYGPVHHPLDTARSPGGSSGGSAAAVVAGLGVASIGTDTGGSIRIPSAACGIVGLKPTWGEVPAAGVVPLAHSLDHVGPLAGSVDDVAAVFAALAGSRPAGVPGSGREATADEECRAALTGLRLGRLEGYFTDVLDPMVRSAHASAIEALGAAGATIAVRDVEGAALTAPVYLLTVFAEAAAVHARWLERSADEYTPAVRVRLEVARFVLGEDYVRAQRLRARLADAVDRALEGCEALVLPTLPIVAPPLGASTVIVGSRRQPVRAMTLRLTQLFDLTGHPAISLPLWPASSPLPTGLQLVGRRGATWDLLDTARRVERVIRRSLDPRSP